MKHLQTFLVMILAVFAPIQPLLITTMILIGADFVSGIVSAHKRRALITSGGFRRTISKLVIYELALMLGFLAETYMMPLLPVTKMVSSLLALTELKSIYENLDIMVGGSLLKTVVNSLNSQNVVESKKPDPDSES